MDALRDPKAWRPYVDPDCTFIDDCCEDAAASWQKCIDSGDKLELCHYQLIDLPPEVWDLTDLEWLCCGLNHLKTLPVDIRKLTKLKYFDCSDNKLTELPLEIGYLTNLIEFYCHDNPFEEEFDEDNALEYIKQKLKCRYIKSSSKT